VAVVQKRPFHGSCRTEWVALTHKSDEVLVMHSNRILGAFVLMLASAACSDQAPSTRAVRRDTANASIVAALNRTDGVCEHPFGSDTRGWVYKAEAMAHWRALVVQMPGAPVTTVRLTDGLGLEKIVAVHIRDRTVNWVDTDSLVQNRVRSHFQGTNEVYEESGSGRAQEVLRLVDRAREACTSRS
jgi:hypothetical protein